MQSKSCLQREKSVLYPIKRRDNQNMAMMEPFSNAIRRLKRIYPKRVENTLLMKTPNYKKINAIFLHDLPPSHGILLFDLSMSYMAFI